MKGSILIICVVISTATASIIGGAATLVGPAAPGIALKGPAAHAAVIGPDGSVISAASDAGAIVSPPIAGGVVSAAVAPGVVTAHVPAVVAGHVPIVGNLGTVIDGPSGIIKTAGNPYGFIGAVPAGLPIAPIGIAHAFHGYPHAHGIW